MTNCDWNYAVVVNDDGTDVGWGPFATREHAEMWANNKLGGVEYTILHLTRLPSMAQSREGSGT